MAEARQNQDTGVRCMIIPLHETTLVLPGSVVAEVAAYQDPRPVTAGALPPWLMGLASWRGMNIPLVSVEGLMSENAPGPGVRARMIVVKGLAGHPRLPFYGVVAQQIPRLINVAPGAIEPLDAPEMEGAPGEAVLAGGEAAVMLDVDTVEERILDALYR